MKKKFEDVKKIAATILYPPVCPVCKKILGYQKLICRKCSGKMIAVGENTCKSCGKPLENEEREYCYDCSKKKHYYEQGVAAFRYNETVKKTIYEFKYQNKREYARYYSSQLILQYDHIFKQWGIEAIVPVPIYKLKKRKRGFNQAQLIGKELSYHLQIPCINQWLIRVKNTIPQKELNDAGRKKNLEDAFAVKKDYPYKTVLLVDDIYTTGSTIDHCAKILRANGCQKVYFAAVSIGQGI